MRTAPAEVLIAILNELVHGSPDPAANTVVLNQGDPGLLASLARLTAEQANARPANGGASVAAHVDHLRYALMLLNRWAGGSPPPWPDMDWTTSWKLDSLTDSQWLSLRTSLADEATRWAAALAEPRVRERIGEKWATASVAHLAYHMGAIRQIAYGARGPRAEDEASAQERAKRERG